MFRFRKVGLARRCAGSQGKRRG